MKLIVSQNGHDQLLVVLAKNNGYFATLIYSIHVLLYRYVLQITIYIVHVCVSTVADQQILRGGFQFHKNASPT